MDQASEQVHKRSLARAVRPHEAGNSLVERETGAVHAQNFPVELGDVIEGDLAIGTGHPRTTSRARKRAFRTYTEATHTRSIMSHAAKSGTCAEFPRNANS